MTDERPNEFQRAVLEAAIRAEARTGEAATLGEIAREHGTAINNVREFLIQLAAIGYVGTRKRGKHTTYYVLRDSLGHEFDRAEAHRQYLTGRADAFARRVLAETPLSELRAAGQRLPPVVGHVSAGALALAPPDVEPQPLLVFDGDIVADTVTLDADDPEHGALRGDVVIRELRPAEPGDWVVNDWPAIALFRRY